MNRENTKRLFTEFPELFDRDLLPCGYECQDGWFDLLYELAGRISSYRKQCSEDLYLEVIRVRQCLGRLQFTLRGGDSRVRKMIEEAEHRSTRICELDGETAIGLFVCAPHWYRHLCTKCAGLHDCMNIEDYRPEASVYALTTGPLSDAGEYGAA